MSWRWISKPGLLLLHGESLSEHGGGAGLRDEGLLDSALARPLNRYRLTATQADTTITMLAVADGSITEEAFADWIRQKSGKKTR